MTLECCCVCDSATGRAGRYDDSLYIGEHGPLCESCYDNKGAKKMNEQNDAWIEARAGCDMEKRWESEYTIASDECEFYFQEYVKNLAGEPTPKEAFRAAWHCQHKPSVWCEEIEIRIWNEAIASASDRVYLALGPVDSIKFIDGMIR